MEILEPGGAGAGFVRSPGPARGGFSELLSSQAGLSSWALAPAQGLDASPAPASPRARSPPGGFPVNMHTRPWLVPLLNTCLLGFEKAAVS